MLTRFILLLGLGCCLVAGVVRTEEDAAGRLIDALSGLDQLQGRFEQQQYDAAGGELVATSTGSFRLLRPGYFAWDIETPDSQLVIADRQHVWHYDRDLETVTRRPAGGEAASPLQVLGGNTEVLRTQYQVSVTDGGQFQLLPLGEGAGFRSLVLYLDDGQLQGMDIVDNLNQTLKVRFSALDSTTRLSPEDFAFSPPEGADLFYHDR